MTTHDAKCAMSAGGFRAETEMGSGGRCVLIVTQYMRNQCSLTESAPDSSSLDDSNAVRLAPKSAQLARMQELASSFALPGYSSKQAITATPGGNGPLARTLLPGAATRGSDIS